jgi:hypothetical protein
MTETVTSSGTIGIYGIWRCYFEGKNSRFGLNRLGWPNHNNIIGLVYIRMRQQGQGGWLAALFTKLAVN